MERLDPFRQPAVLVGTQVPIPEVCRKVPVDLALLRASGIVPFQLVAELVLLFSRPKNRVPALDTSSANPRRPVLVGELPAHASPSGAIGEPATVEHVQFLPRDAPHRVRSMTR